MAQRKAISKGKRFEVFQRDGFTCQYCGEKPPNVVLHLDHIVPVADGGDNDIMNLITSCAACNLGKNRKRLENLPQRPDADLAWLELQQELAELRQYQAAKIQREQLVDRIIELLQDTWIAYSGLDWHPASHIVRMMLAKYSPTAIEEAFKIVAPKVEGGYIKEYKWLPYTWVVLRNLEGANEDGERQISE